MRAIETGKFPHALEPEDKAIIALSSLGGEQAGGIAVFTSPYGDGEDSPLEKSVKVPLAIWAPDLLSPRTAGEILVSTVDVVPTVLGLRGEPIPKDVEGRDLSKLLLGKNHDLPDSIYIEGGISTAAEWRAVIRGFDKLVMDLNGNATHLYNLADDPEETANLVLDSSTQLTRDALVALARTWMRRTGDHMDPSGLRRR